MLSNPVFRVRGCIGLIAKLVHLLKQLTFGLCIFGEVMPFSLNFVRMKYFKILFLLIFIQACNASGQTWTLHALVAGMPDQRIYLSSLKGEKQTLIDSAASLSGAFTFTFDVHAIPGIYRVSLGSNQNTGIYGREAKSFDFVFDREDVLLKTAYSDPVKEMDIIQSDENKQYYEFIRLRSLYMARFNGLYSLLNLYDSADSFYSDLAAEFVRIQQELNDSLISLSHIKPGGLASSLISMFPEPVYHPGEGESIADFMRGHYFDLVHLNDPALINSPVYTQKILTYLSFFREPSVTQTEQEKLFSSAIDSIMDAVSGNKQVDEFVLNYLIDGFERSKMEHVLVHISDYVSENCETDDDQLMQNRLEAFKKMAIGQKVEDIVLPDANDRPQKLSGLNNNYVLLIFWASWCPHCQDLMPHLKEWYEKNASGTGLGVYAVAIDTSRADWEEYLMMNSLPWVNVREPGGWDGKVARRFNIYATPTMFILDRNRKILAKPVTYRDFKKEMERISH